MCVLGVSIVPLFLRLFSLLDVGTVPTVYHFTGSSFQVFYVLLLYSCYCVLMFITMTYDDNKWFFILQLKLKCNLCIALLM